MQRPTRDIANWRGEPGLEAPQVTCLDIHHGYMKTNSKLLTMAASAAIA